MVRFEEENHKYFDTLTNEEIPSVTTILSKVLGNNYLNVNEEVLKLASEKGKFVHKEIENYLMNGEEGFSDELDAFKRFCVSERIIFNNAEQVVFGSIDGMKFAGTYDLFSIDRNLLADIKTTSVFNKEKTAYQLSFYAFALEQSGILVKDILGLQLRENEYKKFELNRKTREELQQILFAYYNNAELETATLDIDNNFLSEVAQAETVILSIKNQLEKAEENAKAMREKLYEAMINQNVKKFENNLITLTLIEPTTRESIDSIKLKKELPEVAEQYKKTSAVKGSVRIKVKELELCEAN